MAIEIGDDWFKETNRKLLRFYAFALLPVLYLLRSVASTDWASNTYFFCVLLALFAQPTALFILFPGKFRFARELEVSIFKAIPFLSEFGMAMERFFETNEAMEPELKEYVLNFAGILLIPCSVIMLIFVGVGL